MAKLKGYRADTFTTIKKFLQEGLQDEPNLKSYVKSVIKLLDDELSKNTSAKTDRKQP